MLSRHFLRCKVLQELYACQIEPKEPMAAVRDFEYHIGKLNELGTLQVALLLSMREAGERVLEDAKHKFRPSQEEKEPNRKFLNNIFLCQMADNFELKQNIGRWGGCWETHDNLVREAFLDFRQTKLYGDYMSSIGNEAESDKDFVINMFKWLMNKESLVAVMQERSLLWEDDFEQIAQYNFMMLKTLDPSTMIEAMPWPIMYDKRQEKDESDMDFARMLLLKSIEMRDESNELVRQRLQGWELERVAQMDLLLINMAVAEFVHCSSIPEKVTVDEYIELSKEFSTERSRLFINGILDKLVLVLRSQGRIKKSGRGLLSEAVDDITTDSAQ